MPDADTLLRRLREDERHLQALVTLAVDDLMSRPVEELVDPAWLSERLVEAMRSSASDKRTREWIRGRLDEVRQRAGKEQGTLAQRVSPQLVRAVKDLLRRPYTPDPALVRAIIDHRAMRNLIQDLLQTTLTEYARKVQEPTRGAVQALKSSPLGRSRLAQLAGAAGVAARVVGSEVERQLEGRIREFVDGAISRSIDLSVTHFCAPEHARDVADWRADSVDVVLWFPVETWRREFDKLDPEQLIDDLAELLVALANAEGFTEQLRGLLEQAVREAGGATARDFLSGSGLEEEWRPHLEALALERMRAFVATEGFEAWLRALAAD
ncbi:MAG: hypothetical protein H6739_26795 [Alphaproteobacteria bacterium]|nr:hypothetical protein [Alphaproteobacteria bacterium]